MSKKIIFYGDSNTYGFDPRGFFGGRYDRGIIWTDRIGNNPEYDVCPCGENGRQIPHTASAFDALDRILKRNAPFDLFSVMLGTNDLFMMYEADGEKICGRMEQLLKFVLSHDTVTDSTKVLLVSPPGINLRENEYEMNFSRISYELGAHYMKLADRLGVYFADAAGWKIDTAYDGVHFSERGHAEFAVCMERLLGDIFAG
ncbi:MAG: GDSL-type esterase/lipase family protein [Bacillota bacterium]|nr:GDSL-type esterase/lipase family protein [Bacillota bacterium]